MTKRQYLLEHFTIISFIFNIVNECLQSDVFDFCCLLWQYLCWWGVGSVGFDSGNGEG
jgi:hypothetical protein